MQSSDTILLKHRTRVDTHDQSFITAGVFCDWHALFKRDGIINPHTLTFLEHAKEAGYQVYVLSDRSRVKRDAFSHSPAAKFTHLVCKMALFECQVKQDKLLEFLIDPAPIIMGGGAVTLIHPDTFRTMLEPSRHTVFKPNFY